MRCRLVRLDLHVSNCNVQSKQICLVQNTLHAKMFFVFVGLGKKIVDGGDEHTAA